MPIQIGDHRADIVADLLDRILQFLPARAQALRPILGVERAFAAHMLKIGRRGRRGL